MMHQPQFINWQPVPQPDGKPRKVPTNPHTRLPIDPHDPSQWMTREQAAASGLPVGFVLTDRDNLFLIDLDDCRDPATGQWHPEALCIAGMFPGACMEVSVNGTGLHIMGVCDAFALGPRKHKFGTTARPGNWIEFYHSKRFVALGQGMQGDVHLDWTSTLAALVPVSSDPADAVPFVDVADPAWNGPADDDELITAMLKSRGSIAATFGDVASVADLWEARVEVLGRLYPSTTGDAFDHSSADQALCNNLAFWTGKNTARMDRLFRRSGLMREKWGKRADYRTMTVSRAVQSTRNVYSRSTAALGLPVGTTAGRSFEDIITDARNVATDDVKAVKCLCAEAAALDPVERSAILQQIKTNTNIPMADLKNQANIDEGEPDHRDLALRAIEDIGAENIIQVGQFTWKFSNGLWKKCDDREVKQRVQNTLAGEHHTITAPRVNGVTETLKNHIHKSDHDFNRGNPESVNCLNGELELLNGEWSLQPHNRQTYRTTQIPVAYDPTATAPLFELFLLDIFRNDEDRNEKIRLLLEMMGYSLMSHANREKFVLLIGAGANGKSVILGTLEALLGKDNVAGVQPARFNDKFQRGHLDQKLANIVTELKQGETIADAELKAITSGEAATVEHKNKDPFVMRPFATCWFGTNHMPATRDYSDAFFRRALVVTFNRVLAPHEQDPNLKGKLKAELPGILNHVLAAYAQVVARNGFTIPASSKAAQRKWQVEADQVAQFVEDRCAPVSGGRTGISILYSIYQGWAKSTGIRNVLGQQTFGDRLEALGYPRYRTMNERGISGLNLNGPQL